LNSRKALNVWNDWSGLQPENILCSSFALFQILIEKLPTSHYNSGDFIGIVLLLLLEEIQYEADPFVGVCGPGRVSHVCRRRNCIRGHPSPGFAKGPDRNPDH
jgi:hypothetical protein